MVHPSKNIHPASANANANDEDEDEDEDDEIEIVEPPKKEIVLYDLSTDN